MNQEKSKLIIERLAFSHSKSVSRLIASMTTAKINRDEDLGKEMTKPTMHKRIPVDRVTWIMNRSISI